MCQTAFSAVLASYAAKNKPFVVVTTHSPQIIQAAPKSCLQFVYRDGANSKVQHGDPVEVLLRTVGIENKIKCILLVEDNAARVFSKLWINHFAPRKVSSVEFLILGGEGNVTKALESLPQNPKTVSFVGLLDGDAEARGFAGRVAFLPGGKPIEQLYKEMLETELARVSPLLGIENLDQILFGMRGLELHEWFEHLKQNSNLSSEQLHLVLFNAWIQKPANREIAEKYFGQFDEKRVG
jgi:hypothetical protein